MNTVPVCPYVGIRPFNSEESLFFFGRDEQTLQILQLLHKNHFVAVVGGSGSGKSSLIRAGLIPALKGGHLVEDCSKWMIAVMKPGRNPVYSLAKAILQQVDPDTTHESVLEFIVRLKKEGVKAVIQLIGPIRKEQKANFFLLVDQFEELFRFSMEIKDAPRKTEAVDFVNLMLGLTKQKEVPFYVVLTMRSDFIGDCAQFHDLPEALNQSQYLVPRLNRQQLKMVIEGPARLFGVRFSPALTSQLLNDLGNVKDELPLIQHALMRMWDFEMTVDKSGELDLNDYKAIGGYELALSRHADETLESLDEADKGIAKVLFQALTAIDENGRKIRRPLLLRDLKEITGATENRLLGVVDHFIKDKRSFLILEHSAVKDETLIDIAHESLIRQWDTLSKWVDEEGESAEVYRKLSEDTRLYKARKKDYLSGSELQLALEWRDKFSPTAVWANRYSNEGFEDCMRYLKESWEESIKLHKFSRAKKRRLRMLYFVIVLIFISLIGAILSYFKVSNLNNLLEVQTKKANSYYLSSESKLQANDNPTLSLRLAENALGLFDTIPLKRTAQDIYHNNSFYRIVKQDSAPVRAFEFSFANRTILVGHYDGTLSSLDFNGRVIRNYKIDGGVITALAFSRDGNSILCGSEDGTARLILKDGTVKSVYRGHASAVYAVAFSPDDKTVLTGSTDQTARLWDAGSGALLQEFKGRTPMRTVYAVAFSPDGKTILTGSRDQTARLWNLSGRLLQVFDKHAGSVNAVAFSPDGKNILTGSSDQMARLWELKGDLVQEFRGHTAALTSVAFSRDGRYIYTGSEDQTVRIWQLNGENLQIIKGHSGPIWSLAISPDNKTLLTGGKDNTARLWNLKLDLHLTIKGYNGSIKTVAFARGDSVILTGSDEVLPGSEFYGARLWDATSGELLRQFAGHRGTIYAVALSPDGKKILTASRDGTARLWDINGDSLQTFTGHKDRIFSAVFSPDGKSILTASRDTTTRLWNLKGEQLKVFKAASGPVYSVVFSPRGDSFFTCSEDRIGRLWDLESGEVIQEFDKYPISTAAFSPDGSSILTGSLAEDGNIAHLWALDANELMKFEGHEYNINAVAFSHDGNKILTGSDDRTAILWDCNGNILQEFKRHTSFINSVAFSSDDKFVLTGSNDATVRLWKIAMPLMEFLSTDWGEPLSETQRRQFRLMTNDSLKIHGQ